jgi:DNA-binding MarR family transcriptional regulator
MHEDQANLAHAVGKRSPFSSLRQEAYLNLMRTQAIASAPFDQLFKAHGISQPLYNILRILQGHEQRDRDAGREHRGLPVLRIGQEMVTREPDMTRLINRLEKAGLALRCRCEHDRRVIYVRLTDEGRTLLGRLKPATEALHAEQFPLLSEDELATLIDLLFRAAHHPEPDAEAPSDARGTDFDPGTAP